MQSDAILRVGRLLGGLIGLLLLPGAILPKVCSGLFIVRIVLLLQPLNWFHGASTHVSYE